MKGVGSLPTVTQDRPRSLGYAARLGSTYLRAAPSQEAPINITTRDREADRVADSSNVYENTLDIGYEYVRQDLSGGEGLDFWPRPFNREQSEQDALRFFDAYHLDVTRPRKGQQFRTHLVNDWSIWDQDPTTSTFSGHGLAASAARLYVADDNEVAIYDDINDPTSLTVVTVGSSSFDLEKLDATSDDQVLAWNNNRELWYKPIGTTVFTQVPNTGGVLDDIENFWLVKQRIIVFKTDTAAATPGTLEELDLGLGGTPASPTFSPTSVIIDTVDGIVTAVTDGGIAVLAATNDGYVRSYVPAQQSADASDIFLELRGRTQVPSGEYPFAVHEEQGIVLILTLEPQTDHALGFALFNMRAYRASLLDERFDFILGEMQLLREWVNVREPATVGVPSGFNRYYTRSTRDGILFTVPERNKATGSAPLGTAPQSAGAPMTVWQLDLVTGGLVRLLAMPSDSLTKFVIWQNQLFTSLGGANLNVYRLDSDLFVTSGFLVTPSINFGVHSNLAWIEASLEGTNFVNAGDQIDLYLSTDSNAINRENDSSWMLVGSITANGAYEFELNGIEATSAALQVVITAGANSSTPELIRFGIRAFPSQRDFIIDLPVNVSDNIEVPYRRPIRIPGWGNEVLNFLHQQVGAGLDLELFNPPIKVRGIVDAVGQPITYISDRGSSGRYCIIRFRGDRLAERTFQVSMAFETDSATTVTTS